MRWFLSILGVEDWTRRDWLTLFARYWLVSLAVSLGLFFTLSLNMWQLGEWSLDAAVEQFDLWEGIGLSAAGSLLFTPMFFALERWAYDRIKPFGVDVFVVLTPVIVTVMLILILILRVLITPEQSTPETTAGWTRGIGEVVGKMVLSLLIPTVLVAFVHYNWTGRLQVTQRRTQGIAIALAVLLVTPTAVVAVDPLSEGKEGSSFGGDSELVAVEGDYQEDGPLRCEGGVEATPAEVYDIQPAEYTPVEVHTGGSAYQSASYRLEHENGTVLEKSQHRYKIRVRVNGSDSPLTIDSGAYVRQEDGPDEYDTISGLGHIPPGGEGVVEFDTYDGPAYRSMHVWYDVVHPDGTVHRHVTKLCHTNASGGGGS